MNKYAYNDITFMQYTLFIHSSQVGIGILQLPRQIAASAGTAGWMSILIGWALSVAASLVLIQVMKKHPGDTIIDLLPRYFGVWIGRLFTLAFAIYFGILAYTVMSRASLFITSWILPQTADYVLMLLFCIPTYMVVRNGLRVQGRYSELVFFLSLWMPLFYLLPLKDAHWNYLLPLVKDGWSPIVQTTSLTVNSFLGFETALFLYPFLKNKETAVPGIVIANTLSMLVFLFVTLACFVYFSPEGILQFNEPTLNILKAIQLSFLERPEIVFLAFYLVIISTTWMPNVYWSIFCTSQLLGKQNHHRHLVIFLLLSIAITFFYKLSFDKNDQLQRIIGMVGVVIAFVLPVILWLYMAGHRLIRRRRTP
ncbi:endospore germination permease [Paenibacillus vulneris]|uniref:Endospore germination permease n=1 Tax=Paenibacillus vulneris TaxID=1133364 RepID=A0ABW3UVX4_9BACL|nr:endospore germination permease [Paenibacillus sp. 32352]